MITLDDEIREVTREIGQRRHVYARLVGDKRMFQADADRQIAVMQAVLARLQAEKAKEAPGLPGLMPPVEARRRG